MDSSLVMSSASSRDPQMRLIRLHGAFRFLKWSQTWTSPAVSSSSFSYSLLLSSATSMVWLKNVLVKMGKTSFSTSVFPTSQVTRTPIFFQHEPTFSLLFLSSLRYLQKQFLLPFMSTGQCQLSSIQVIHEKARFSSGFLKMKKKRP